MYSTNFKISQGGYGEVYSAIHIPSGNPVAIKIEDFDWAILNELMIMKSLDSEYIIKARDVYIDKGKIHVVMDLGDCDLRSAIFSKKIKPIDIPSIIEQLIKSIDYLHVHDIIHGDIKTSNFIMFDNYTKIKLIDFGLSCAEPINRFCGGYTIPYRPPEISDTKLMSKRMKKQSDIWALGVCIFELLCEMEMFVHTHAPGNHDTVYDNDVRLNREERLNVIYGAYVSNPESYINLIRLMTLPNLYGRITSSKALEILGSTNYIIQHTPLAFPYSISKNDIRWKEYRINVFENLALYAGSIKMYLLAVYIFDKYSSIKRTRISNAKDMARTMIGLATIRMGYVLYNQNITQIVNIARTLDYSIEYPNVLTEMVKLEDQPCDSKQMLRIKDFVYNDMYETDIHYNEYILV